MNSRPGVTATADMGVMECWASKRFTKSEIVDFPLLHYSNAPLLQGSLNIIFSREGVLQELYILDQNTKYGRQENPHGIEASLVKEIYCFGGVPFCEESLEG